MERLRPPRSTPPDRAVERAVDQLPVVPVLMPLEPHVRSPLLGLPPIDDGVQDPGVQDVGIEPEVRAASAVVLPPTTWLVATTMWVVGPAAPVLIAVGWQPAVLSAAAGLVLREVRRRVRRAAFSFGDGLLPYRAQDGWPHGVQEDDDVRWDWSRGPTRPGGHATNDLHGATD